MALYNKTIVYMFSAKWESVQFRNCTCALWEFLFCPSIPELYRTILELRKGYFIDFCYDQALRNVGMGWTKWELGEHVWESHFNFNRLQRGVFSYNPTAATSNTLQFVCTDWMFCITGIILYVTMREREIEREKDS